MYLAVKQFLTDNKILTREIPHFAETFGHFAGIIDDIEAASEEQLKNRKGIAEKKKELQDNLVAIISDYSAKLRCYAQQKPDIMLEEKIRLSKSAIRDLRDNSLLAYSESVFDLAASIDADLTKFLITRDTDLVFRKAIDGFSESLDKPRLGIVERKQSTLKLNTLFMEGNSSLRQIDTLLMIIGIKEPSFTGNYLNVRKIVAGNAGPLSLRVKVVSGPAGAPVGGATVSCIPADSGADPNGMRKGIKRKSGPHGGIAVKNLFEGKYQVLVSKAGYAPKVTTLTVTNKERKDVVVKLEKTII